MVPVNGLIYLEGSKLGLIPTKGRFKIRKFHAYNTLRHPLRISLRLPNPER